MSIPIQNDVQIALTGTVLIVDDIRTNREILADFLMSDGHQVIQAASGPEALKLIEDQNIDVMLLDVMMPGMSGFEVCREIKDSHHQDTHVILITALDDRDNQINGFESGADDYFSKPIDTQCLRLRIKNAMRMKNLHNQVQKQFTELQTLAESRDSLVHMLAHDIRNQLATVEMGTHVLLDSELSNDELKEMIIDSLKSGSRHVSSMINEMVKASKTQENKLPVNIEFSNEIQKVVGHIVSQYPTLRNSAPVTLDISSERGAQFDESLLIRILQNLIGNARKFTPPQGRIEVEVKATTDDNLRISVSDEGPGIPENQKAFLFNPVATIDHTPELNEIGLVFCKLAAESMGGNIGCRDREDGGSEIWIELSALPEGLSS